MSKEVLEFHVKETTKDTAVLWFISFIIFLVASLIQKDPLESYWIAALSLFMSIYDLINSKVVKVVLTDKKIIIGNKEYPYKSITHVYHSYYYKRLFKYSLKSSYSPEGIGMKIQYHPISSKTVKIPSRSLSKEDKKRLLRELGKRCKLKRNEASYVDEKDNIYEEYL